MSPDRDQKRPTWQTQPAGRPAGSGQPKRKPLRTPPRRRGGGVMCHRHSQVAASQAGRAVMSGEGSGQAAGQERLPLRLLGPQLLSCPPVLWRGPCLTSPPPSRRPRLPPSLPTPPAHQALPREGFHNRGRAQPPDWVEGWKTI